MMLIHSFVTSIIPLIILLTKINASQYRYVRQANADVCPNQNGNTCIFVTCENGGTCVEDPTTLDCFKCQCAPGFTGKICDSTISVIPSGCVPPCQNGICDINVCRCSQGYTGTFCQTRDYCLPTNPCLNGGRCTSIGTSYTCDCLGTGHTGPVCNEPIATNPCSPNPCQNGGICRPDGTTMTCLCVNGYTGSVCSIPPIPCASAPCENGGKCELLIGNTYGCVCPEEYTGTRCETHTITTHPCVTQPTTVCQNGGECTMNGAGFICKCIQGWGGVNCQTREVISTCNPNPCNSHGVCYLVNINTGVAAHCNCEDRWTGKYCDVNMDINCPIGYCLSGGTCRMNGNTPYCDCPPLYTGQRCDLLIGSLTTTTTAATSNLCPSNPCKNGGTCYGDSSTFQCVCAPNWTGPLCDAFMITITTTGMTTITPGNTVCSINPCSNGGACYPSANSYMCICKTPFTGRHCETVQTTAVPLSTTTGIAATCAEQPCKNGGTCVPMGTSYSCFCGTNSIYTGKNCDLTTPMTADECPLDCAPGRCIFSGNPQKPYACLWNGIMRPIDGTTG